MNYSATKPPVIKANLGSTPWSDIATVKPWIEYVTLAGAAVDLDNGPVLAINHELTQIAATPVWIHKLGETQYVIPTTGLELTYIITRGNGGPIVEEGTVTIHALDITPSEGSIASVEFVSPGGVEIPSSVGGTKTYPILFTPKSFSGAIQTINNAKISIIAQSTGLPLIDDVPMAVAGGVYKYEWLIVYTNPEEIYTIKVNAHYDGSGTNFVTFQRLVEVYKRREFNPIRVKSGLLS